jgi:Galactose oxidase, central domain
MKANQPASRRLRRRSNPIGLLLAGLLLAVGAPAQLTWKKLKPSRKPSARLDSRMVYDKARGQVVLFGGISKKALLSDTWLWKAGTWTKSSATGPSPRYAHAMIYDDRSRVVMLFGGRNTTQTRLADTWVWNGNKWRRLNPKTSPPARNSHAMAYHAATGRAVLFGGEGSGGKLLGDTWTWDGTTWKQVSLSPPTARCCHTLAYHTATKSTILLGGTQTSSGTTHPREAWKWNGSAWTALAIPPTATALGDHSMVADEARDRLFVFGGATNPHPKLSSDSWDWDGAKWLKRTPATGSPTGRSGMGLAYDTARREVIMFGGQANGLYNAETWTLKPASPASFTPFGTACGDSAGTPSISTDGLPWVGTTFRVALANAPPNQSGVLFLGTCRNVNLAPFGAPGCWLYAVNLLVPFTVSAVGGTSVAILAPPGTVGSSGCLQFLVASNNTSRPFNIVATRGARVTVGSK